MCGCYHCLAIRSHFHSCRRNSTKGVAASHRMGDGWHTLQTNRAHFRFTCRASPHRAANGRFLLMVVLSRHGGAMVRSCSTYPKTRKLWRMEVKEKGGPVRDVGPTVPSS